MVENATVTGDLDVIDNGRIQVQPSEVSGTPVVVVGKAVSQSLHDAGVLIARGHKEVRLNAKAGLIARNLTVDTTRIEGQSATFSSKVKTTQLFAKEIRPIKGTKKTTFICARQVVHRRLQRFRKVYKGPQTWGNRDTKTR